MRFFVGLVLVVPVMLVMFLLLVAKHCPGTVGSGCPYAGLDEVRYFVVLGPGGLDELVPGKGNCCDADGQVDVFA